MKLNCIHALKQVFIFILVISTLLATGCGNKAEDARRELGKLNVQYTVEAFEKAIENKDSIVCKLFLDAGMSVESKDKNGITPLMSAASSGNMDMLAKIMEKDANISETNNNGQTAFMLSVSSGQLETSKALLSKGLDINAVDKDSASALTLAAKNGKTEMVTFLLQQPGINVNLPQNDQMTALMLACQGGYIDIVKALLEAKADISLKNNRGLTALQIAQRNENVKVIDVLKSYGAHDVKYFGGEWHSKEGLFKLTIFQNGESLEGKHFGSKNNRYTQIDSPGDKMSLHGTVQDNVAEIDWVSGRDQTPGKAVLEMINDNEAKWHITSVGKGPYGITDYIIPRDITLFRE